MMRINDQGDSSIMHTPLQHAFHDAQSVPAVPDKHDLWIHRLIAVGRIMRNAELPPLGRVYRGKA